MFWNGEYNHLKKGFILFAVEYNHLKKGFNNSQKTLTKFFKYSCQF